MRTLQDRITPTLRRRLAALAVVALALLLAALPARAAGVSWTSGGAFPGIGAGRVWQVAFSPGSPTAMLAATDNGVYQSKNAGQSWSQVAFSGTRVWTVGFDVRNGSVALAGIQNGGIRMSKDGGAHWSDASAGLADRNVRCFGFSQSGIAAGTDNGVALSVDGASWHRGGLEGYGISALATAQNSPSAIFIAGVDQGNVSAGYIFRSHGDAQWEVLSNGLPQGGAVNSIAVGPLAASATVRPIIATTTKGTLRSGDGGTTWTASALPQDTTLSLTTATFSPLDPNLVYAGADAGGSSGGGVMRSTDGGASFTPADQGLPAAGQGGNPPARREVETLAVAPTNPPTVVAGVDPFDATPAGAVTYRLVDTGAPSPPALAAEAGGVPTLPSVPPTPPPTLSTPKATGGPTPAASQGIVGRIAGTLFGFPIPLIPEILLAGVLFFLYRRWKQRYYVEGPP
jgi:hypothetical protein